MRLVTRFLGFAALLALLLASPLARAQSWTTIPIGFYPGTMVLMTDGTVLVHYVTEDSSGNLHPSGIWEKLTPDAFGNYADGTWSQLPAMPGSYAPQFHATAVLPDGRLLVEGGEYTEVSGSKVVDTGLGAIYDPVSNSWTSVNPPPGVAGQNGEGYGGGANGVTYVGDASSVILPDGQLMLGDCCGEFFALFNASSLSWNSYYDQGKLAIDTSNGEEGWTLLPNGKVLTVDLWGDATGGGAGTTAMLYDPGTNSWSPTGSIPVNVEDPTCHEIGPMVLRRNGTVTVVGGNGQLATYNSSNGTWAAGPLIGNPYGDDDGPGVLLPNGNIFFEVSPYDFIGDPNQCYEPPQNGAVFFEWDGTTLTQEPGPPDEPEDAASVEGRMLVLPTGKVLYDAAYYGNNKNLDKNLYLYTPTGSYQAAWQPQITSVASTLYTDTVNNSISGTQFNGQSQGSMYGDDEQMAENFPLVYIKNINTGHVFYCRTHGFSTMAVATGSATVSAEFDIPGNVETGPSDLVVVTDGIPSPPVSVTVDYGPGQQNVTVSPTSLSMHSRNGGIGSGTATLTNNGPGTLGINGVWVDGDDFSLSSTTCSSSLAQGSSCFAYVEFNPGPYCISGTQYGTLYFSDSATSGEQRVSLSGTQSGCIQAPTGGGEVKPDQPVARPAAAPRGGK